MSFPQVYQGSYGYTIPITTGRDLRDSTDFLLEIRAPSGARQTRPMTSVDVANAAKGVVNYVVQETDFAAEADVYTLQLVDVTAGRRIYFSPASVLVVPGEDR